MRVYLWRLKIRWRDIRKMLNDKQSGFRPIWGAYLLLAMISGFVYSLFPGFVEIAAYLILLSLAYRAISRFIHNVRFVSQANNASKQVQGHQTIRITKAQPKLPYSAAKGLELSSQSNPSRQPAGDTQPVKHK